MASNTASSELYIYKHPCPQCEGDMVMIYEPYRDKNGTRICGQVCVDCGYVNQIDSKQMFSLYTGKNRKDIWDMDQIDFDAFEPTAQRIISKMKKGKFFEPPKPKPKPKAKLKPSPNPKPKPNPSSGLDKIQEKQKIYTGRIIVEDVDRLYEQGQFQKIVEIYEEKRRRGFVLEKRELFRYAFLLSEMGRHKHSLDSWSMYIQRYPNDEDIGVVYNNRGFAYDKLGYVDNATKDYEQALNHGYQSEQLEQIIRTRNAQKVLDYGESLYNNKNYSNAIEQFEEVIQKGIDLENHWFMYAYSLSQAGRNAESIKAYTMYINRYPKTVNAYLNRALQYKRIEAFEKCYLDFIKAFEYSDDEKLKIKILENLIVLNYHEKVYDIIKGNDYIWPSDLCEKIFQRIIEGKTRNQRKMILEEVLRYENFSKLGSVKSLYKKEMSDDIFYLL